MTTSRFVAEEDDFEEFNPSPNPPPPKEREEKRAPDEEDLFLDWNISEDDEGEDTGKAVEFYHALALAAGEYDGIDEVLTRFVDTATEKGGILASEIYEIITDSEFLHDELLEAFARIVTNDFDETEHPRDEAGRFASGGGGGVGAADDDGGVEMVSPSVAEGLTLDQATHEMHSARQRAVMAEAHKVDEIVGISTTQAAAVGAWADGAENSILVRVANKATHEQIRTSAAMKGMLADQKAVIPFHVEKGGPDSMYWFDAPTQDLGELHTGLAKQGVEYHTLEPRGAGTRVWVFDEGSKLGATMEKTGEHYGQRIRQARGKGEFLGSWTSREEGRAAYRKVIEQNLGHDQRTRWDGLYNRWRETHPELKALWQEVNGGQHGDAAKLLQQEGNNHDPEVKRKEDREIAGATARLAARSPDRAEASGEERLASVFKWDEAEHPRADDGKFSSGGGGSGGGDRAEPGGGDAGAEDFSAAVTDTPEFRAWFKDSKVVDKNGDPLVVYHGTKHTDIEHFEVGGDGVFFSASPKVASSYASFAGGEGGNVIAAYLSLQDPLVVVDPDPGRRIGANYYDMMQSELGMQALVGEHDGIIIRAMRGRKDESLYIAFRPEQIKSAVGNRGTFDPDDPDITKHPGSALLTKWDEDKHPRDDSGKFSESDGGGGSAESGEDAGSQQSTIVDSPSEKPAREVLAPIAERFVKQAETRLAAEGYSPEVMSANADKLMEWAKAHPEAWEEGMQWYAKEHELAVAIGKTVGSDEVAGAGMLAATSPRVPVDRARIAAQAAASAVERDGEVTVTRDTVEERYQRLLSLAADQKDATVARAMRADAKANRAKWLKNDLGTYDVLTGDAAKVGSWHPARGTAMTNGWTKAVRIGRGESPDDVLGGEKVRSFWDNMRDPSTSRTVTIDAWMVRGLAGNYALKEEKLAKLVASRGRYEVFARRVRESADRYGVTPLQAQAIMWTAIRDGGGK